MEPASVSNYLDPAGDPREKWVPCAESCVHTGARTWQNLPPWVMFRACQRKRGVNFVFLTPTCGRNSNPSAVHPFSSLCVVFADEGNTGKRNVAEIKSPYSLQPTDRHLEHAKCDLPQATHGCLTSLMFLFY